MTVGDGSGPPAIPPVPRAEEPPVRPPRRVGAHRQGARARATGPAHARPSAVPVPRPGAAAATRPRGPAAPRDRDDSPVVEGPRTRGHLCARGHLNDPRSHFCVLCGIRMNERTGELVFGPRPPLGLLVFDDGATYTVDAEYLVGRMPDVDERVRNGSLRSIVVEDRSGAVSRVHAEVRVDGWDVMLVDSRSRNGTHIAGPGANDVDDRAAGPVAPAHPGHPRAPRQPDVPVRVAVGRALALGGDARQHLLEVVVLVGRCGPHPHHRRRPRGLRHGDPFRQHEQRGLRVELGQLGGGQPQPAQRLHRGAPPAARSGGRRRR